MPEREHARTLLYRRRCAMPNAYAHRRRDRARAAARVTAAGALCALALLAGGAGAGPSSGAGAAEIAASVTPAQPAYGQALQVAGRVITAGHALGGAAPALQIAPFPYPTLTTLAPLLSEADGSFPFRGVRAGANNPPRVLLAGAPPPSSPPP